MPGLAELRFTVVLFLFLMPACQLLGLARGNAAAAETQPARPKPAANDATAGQSDPALAQRVREAAFIIVSDNVTISKQHPEHVSRDLPLIVVESLMEGLPTSNEVGI